MSILLLISLRGRIETIVMPALVYTVLTIEKTIILLLAKERRESSLNSLRKQDNVFLRGEGGYSITTIITQTNIQTYIQALVDLLVIVQDTKGRDDVRVAIEA